MWDRWIHWLQSASLLWFSVFTDGEWEGWRCRGNQTRWRLQGAREGNIHTYPSFLHLRKHSKRCTTQHIRTGINYCLSLNCTTREQILPAKQWWKSSIKHQSTSSPTLQRELSFPCSTQCPKSAGRWRVRATPSLRASWESAWPSMDVIWARTPTLVRMV